jgi:4,5-DOPA dioxygenase extradiol
MVLEANPLMPAAFLGHGTPMNAISTNRHTEAWASLGATVPRPRGILVVSAHWVSSGTSVTAMPFPRTIHDFYGFPKPLFEVQYPAPGDERLAEEIAEIVKPVRVSLDRDTWGIDHGAWSVLIHAFPTADVPVIELSIDAHLDAKGHFELGAKLAPLRERGVLVIGSGNIVHNLGAIEWSMAKEGFDWAHRFDDSARAILTERPWDAPSLERHPDYALAVPTNEHFIPLLYVAGLASAATAPLDVLVDGYAFGSLSMTSYRL